MKTLSGNHHEEVREAERFQFGRHWQAFLKNVDQQVILQAKTSLLTALNLDNLNGKRFIDAGSGSGLFSLAARLLGADVLSFDIDLDSVACTRELKRRYLPQDHDWVIIEGSVLDQTFVGELQPADIVYSWGVLHHTGALWSALENVISCVADGGLLYIALYNNQGGASRRWTTIKKLYNRLPGPLRFLVLWPAFARLWGPTTVRDVLRCKGFQTWSRYSRENRGMSPWRDVVDWVGGFPFEVSRPEEVLAFCRKRGCELVHLKTCGGGRGCNEYVFCKLHSTHNSPACLTRS
ncbi:MAG: class I SAM-dependent methyltransferase [Planctomycetes bacterium]|nr:class I SAM-dependent methyltransferase [Planctomycetota bacterium]